MAARNIMTFKSSSAYSVASLSFSVLPVIVVLQSALDITGIT